jgi:S1-C subfamily serine protease
MTGLDWLILAGTVLFALAGYARGLIVAALSLVGFVAGAAIGTRIAEALLSSGASSPYAPVFGLVGSVLAGAIVATAFEGIAVRLRRTLPGPLLLLDGLGGALFSAIVALGIAWILGATLLALPGAGGLRSALQRSLILRRLDEWLPPSGGLLGVIERIDPLPSIAAPTATIAAPDPALLAAAPLRRDGRSVVRVLGSACGLGIEGSGWVIAPDEVVTNAHVVAGERDTTVQRRGLGAQLPATVVLFDPHDDLAILRVRGLRLRPLRLAPAPAAGTAGAILGYPEDGPFVAEPGRIGATAVVSTENAYGAGPVLRDLTPVRGLVRPGNSGGPLVDAAGTVLTTIFAATTTAGPHGGVGIANTTVSDDLRRVRGAVSTEGCTG